MLPFARHGDLIWVGRYVRYAAVLAWSRDVRGGFVDAITHHDFGMDWLCRLSAARIASRDGAAALRDGGGEPSRATSRRASSPAQGGQGGRASVSLFGNTVP